MTTFNSTVSCGTVNLNGTFGYTPPIPPGSGSLAGTYTLASNPTTPLTMGGPSTNGASVQFSITVGGQPYSFNGAYANGRITGRTTPCDSPEQDPDNWTASAQ